MTGTGPIWEFWDMAVSLEGGRVLGCGEYPMAVGESAVCRGRGTKSVYGSHAFRTVRTHLT